MNDEKGSARTAPLNADGKPIHDAVVICRRCSRCGKYAGEDEHAEPLFVSAPADEWEKGEPFPTVEPICADCLRAALAVLERAPAGLGGDDLAFGKTSGLSTAPAVLRSTEWARDALDLAVEGAFDVPLPSGERHLDVSSGVYLPLAPGDVVDNASGREVLHDEYVKGSYDIKVERVTTMAGTSAVIGNVFDVRPQRDDYVRDDEIIPEGADLPEWIEAARREAQA